MLHRCSKYAVMTTGTCKSSRLIRSSCILSTILTSKGSKGRNMSFLAVFSQVLVFEFASCNPRVRLEWLTSMNSFYTISILNYLIIQFIIF